MIKTWQTRNGGKFTQVKKEHLMQEGRDMGTYVYV